MDCNRGGYGASREGRPDRRPHRALALLRGRVRRRRCSLFALYDEDWKVGVAVAAAVPAVVLFLFSTALAEAAALPAAPAERARGRRRAPGVAGPALAGPARDVARAALAHRSRSGGSARARHAVGSAPAARERAVSRRHARVRARDAVARVRCACHARRLRLSRYCPRGGERLDGLRGRVTLTALATGLGALPFFVFRRMSRSWLGISNSIAAGFMLGASAALFWEGADIGARADGARRARRRRRSSS